MSDSVRAGRYAPLFLWRSAPDDGEKTKETAKTATGRVGSRVRRRCLSASRVVFLTRPLLSFDSYCRLIEERSLILSFLSILFVILSAPAVLRQTADAGTRPVQIVYESDTRGYYLPCG